MFVRENAATNRPERISGKTNFGTNENIKNLYIVDASTREQESVVQCLCDSVLVGLRRYMAASSSNKCENNIHASKIIDG